MNWENVLLLCSTLAVTYAILVFGTDSASGATTGLLVFILVVVAYAAYAFYRGSSTLDLSDPTFPAESRAFVLTAIFREPLFWTAAGLGAAVALYAYFLDGSALATGASSVAALSPIQQLLLRAFNAGLFLALIGGGLFLVGWALDLLQFQRNDLGLLARAAVFLPCRVYDFVRESAFGATATATATAGNGKYPPLLIVSAVLLCVAAFVRSDALDAQMLWNRLRRAASAAGGESGGKDEEEGASTAVTDDVVLVLDSETVRLHHRWSRTLAEATAADAEVSPFFGVRFRLFLNSQQQAGFFAPNTWFPVMRVDDRTVSDTPKTLLRLRASAEGIVLDAGSSNDASPAAAPLALQRWHDVEIERTQHGELTLSVNRELVCVVVPSTNTALQEKKGIARRAITVTLGPASTPAPAFLHGVISDLVVVVAPAR